ncbi:MAG: hypothetical protein Q4F05_01380 [bacterium]|nr:hypothetical protein [bacterium]
MSQKTVFTRDKEFDKKYILFLFAVSALLMTFGSMTSFLFPMHVGVDQNCFFTIGKSVLDGKVLYKDIYDQKGPLLFFIHTFAALISSKNMYGVYLLQIINFTVILYYVGKIRGLYLGDKYRYLVPAATGLIIVTTFCYSRGDNAEEFIMTFYMIAIYHIMRYLKSGEEVISSKVMFVNGILAASILWIKYTMLGFYIAWCLIVGITVFYRKNFLAAFRAAMLFLSGMFVATIPYILYAVVTDSMGDFLWAYFYTNISLYSTHVSFMRRIEIFFTQDILWNPVMMPTVLLGLIYFCRSKEMLENKWHKFSLVLMAVCTYVFVFIGGTRYKYYLLIFASFTVFGVIFWVKLFEKQIEKLNQHRTRTIAIAVVIYIVSIIGFSNCAPYYFKSADYYPQARIAKIIKEENATVLNYNFLDCGVYLMSESPLPPTRFFCRQNIPRTVFPEMFDAQENLIREKAVDYVLVRFGRNRPLSDFAECPELFTNYTLVDDSYWEPVDDYRFALFKVNK